jgi:L-iditol 2-dehydrogenase
VDEIFLSGTSNERLTTGSRLGARETLEVTVDIDPSQWILDKTKGEGVDAAIVATNVPSVVSEAVRSLRKDGRILLFAGYPAETGRTFDLSEIHYREYQIFGASGHAARDVRKAIELMASGQFDAQPLITHHIPLESICEGLEMKENFIGLKHVVDLK